MVNGYYPDTILDAVKVRKECKGALLISGGTDVMVQKKKNEHVIFLNGIEKMQEVKTNEEYLVIGAAAVYQDLLIDNEIPEILKKSIKEIASPAIRSLGTIGGNICNASPAGDTLPVLYGLDAQVEVAKYADSGEVQTRKIPIEEFILGVRKINLKENEILINIHIPKNSFLNNTKADFIKVGARQSEAISKLSFTSILKEEDGVIKNLAITFGSVGITVIRNKEIENKYLGQPVNALKEHADEIIEEYEKIIHPIDDQRSTAKYRKKVCLNLLRTFLEGTL